MNLKKGLPILTLSALLLLSACSLLLGTPTSNPPTADPQTEVARIVAETMAAQTQIAQAVAETMAALVTDTPQPTQTLQYTYTQQYTFTPQFTYTLQPTYTLQYTFTPQFTHTPSTITVSVSAETNCRSGPGTPYDILGVMLPGQTAEVIGRSADNSTWIIKLPSNPLITCWLWGQWATVTGNPATLPVYAIPPTPTPPVTFTVAYESTIFCSPQYAFRFNITNNGSLTWQSIQIVVTDNNTSTTTTHTRDSFRSYAGCSLELDQLDLTPGETGPVSNINPGQINYNPAGHNFTAVFRLCSENGLLGTCVEKTLNFNP